MSSVKSPAFQFYPTDFLAGRVATYSLEEVGAYIMLLSFDWSLNGLPIERENLARLLRVNTRKFDALWRVVGSQFVEQNGRYFNPRLQLEREKQAEWREKSSKGGKASAAKRGSTTLEPPLPPNGNTPSPSSVTTTTSPPAVAVVSKKPKDSPPSNWVSRLAAEWRGEVGRVSEGQVGAMLKPAHDTHGEHVLTLAMRLWIANQKASGRPCRLAWFADASTQWCHKATAVEAQPVEDGWMSAEMELLTRPKAA